MFKTYTGYEYLLIDAANQFNIGKVSFEASIKWAKDNMHNLWLMVADADKPELFIKALMAIDSVRNKKPTGHMVHMDGSASGVQIMSALTGCMAGSEATGLINPDEASDAYGVLTNNMTSILGEVVAINRADAKQAFMTSLYGSEAMPRNIFGEGTKELAAFYEAAQTTAPGAWQLLQDLLGSWKPFALSHEWIMPDGFEVKVKVMSKKDTRIEVDELNHATFSYEYYVNEGTKFGLSNAANVIHSIDAYIVRCMHRRCNYDLQAVKYARDGIALELIERHMQGRTVFSMVADESSKYYKSYMVNGLADIVVLPYLNEENMKGMETRYLSKLLDIIASMLAYEPFDLVTIHDSFGSSPNNVNWVRYNYKEILADLAESKILDDILSQLYNTEGKFEKLSNDAAKNIRNSNYALT